MSTRENIFKKELSMLDPQFYSFYDLEVVELGEDLSDEAIEEEKELVE